MGFFLLWMGLALLVGAIGSNRNIGFWGSFFLSVLLSPLIGFIVTLISEKKSDIEYKNKALAIQQEQADKLEKISRQPEKKSKVDDLEKLANLKKEGLLTEEEFLQQKKALLNPNE